MTANIDLGPDHPSLVSTASVNRYLKYTKVILERETVLEKPLCKFCFRFDVVPVVITRLYYYVRGWKHRKAFCLIFRRQKVPVTLIYQILFLSAYDFHAVNEKYLEVATGQFAFRIWQKKFGGPDFCHPSRRRSPGDRLLDYGPARSCSGRNTCRISWGATGRDLFDVVVLSRLWHPTSLPGMWRIAIRVPFLSHYRGSFASWVGMIVNTLHVRHWPFNRGVAMFRNGFGPGQSHGAHL